MQDEEHRCGDGIDEEKRFQANREASNASRRQDTNVVQAPARQQEPCHPWQKQQHKPVFALGEMRGERHSRGKPGQQREDRSLGAVQAG